MRLFNRLVMVVVGAALALAGAIAAAFALDVDRFQVAALEEGMAPVTAAAQEVLTQAQNGALPIGTQLLLLVAAITGAALLFFEFRPYRSHMLRLAEGAYVTEPALEHELELAASEVDGTLDVHADVRAASRRKRVRLEAYIREGLDTQAARSEVESRAVEALQRAGLQGTGVRIELAAVDPRDSKARVR